MAARSSGIFPREGYNLDDELKCSGASTDLASKIDLTTGKTIRVICVAKGNNDNVVTVGGIEAVPTGAVSLPYVAHLRGALLADSVVAIAGTTPENASVFIELVDGPRR